MARKDLFRKLLPVAEAVLFIAGYYLITVKLFKLEDPFFTGEPVNIFIALLLFFTLFHGLSSGLLSVILSIPLLEKTYPAFPTNFFLWELLITLLSGEFHYIWNRKIQLLSEENEYLRGKLRNQMSNFILLKLSHDQLEKHYLLKPVSLRSLLTQIKKAILNRPEDAVNLFRDMLSNAFYVQSGSIYRIDGENFFPEIHIGEPVEIDPEDPLVKEVMEREETVFISDIPELSGSQYLAAIPVKDVTGENNLTGIFLIGKLPYNYLNADNILAMSVAVNWFFNQIKDQEKLKNVPENFRKKFSYEFLKELIVLKELHREVKIESSLVVFKVPEIHTDFPLFIEKQVRGMDAVDWLKLNDSIYVFVLLPLSPVEAAEGFIRRISIQLEKTFNEDIELIHRVFPVDKKIFERISYILR